MPNYGAMIKPVTDTATAYFAGQEKDAADASMQQAFADYANSGGTPEALNNILSNPDIMNNETYAPIILKAALRER